MELDKNKLLIKQLPPTIYIKNFIDGHPANYEDFLTTFINSSKLVTCKGNQAFILRKHEEQNHGEADIFNSFYDLDFKIMVDTKYMEARRMLSPTITEFCPGVVGKGPSRLKGERKVYDIIKCFRSMNIDDLIKIEKGLVKLPEGKTIIQVKVCKDTYLSFISKECFVIAQEKDNVLHYYDMIKTSQSNLYTYLYETGKA